MLTEVQRAMTPAIAILAFFQVVASSQIYPLCFHLRLQRYNLLRKQQKNFSQFARQGAR